MKHVGKTFQMRIQSGLFEFPFLLSCAKMKKLQIYNLIHVANDSSHRI